MTKSFYIHIAFATIGVLHILFGPRQLFFQFCHQMKPRRIAAAPETLYIESVADNFYKAIFFQLNTYELINHCQPRTWSYREPYEFLKSVVSTLIEGCLDLDGALIKDLGNKHTTDLNDAFQKEILGHSISRNSIYMYIFFVALYLKSYVQSAAIYGYNYVYSYVSVWYNHVSNYIRDWHLNGDNMAAANNDSNSSGNNGSPGGPSEHPGGNNNAGSSTKTKHKAEPTTRRKHLPIGKKPAAKQQALSSKAPSNVASSSRDSSSPETLSSSNAPITNIDNAAIGQIEKEYKGASDKFQASFVNVNLPKANLERAFSKYQGFVNDLKRDYNPKPEIPLPDLVPPSFNHYLASQEELATKIQHINRLKGKSTDTLDAVTNQLRIAKIQTDKLEQEAQGYSFATRDPFVLLTKETLSQVPPVTKRPANVPSTSHSPVPDATSDSSSPTPGQQPQVKSGVLGPSQGAAPVKSRSKTEKEVNEFLRYLPRYDTTFEDVGFDRVKMPYDIASPPEEYNNYRFPPGTYDRPPLDAEIPLTFAKAKFATSLPPMQEQVPKTTQSKGKQPIRGAGGST